MRPLLLSSLLMLAVGCAPAVKLVPSPTAQAAPGQQNAAVAEVSGVRFNVSANAWRGQPADLPRILTPLHVTIENHSGQPVRVQYQEFALLGSSGFRYAAIPPLQVQGTQVGELSDPAPVGTFVLARAEQPSPRRWVVVRPGFAHRGFYVSPWQRYYYPQLGVWPGYFPWDPLYYDRYYSTWRESLPTRDMVEKALPEGVLESGGTVSGYLYFNDVDRERAVTFDAEVVNAETGASLGTVRIPFTAHRS